MYSFTVCQLCITITLEIFQSNSALTTAISLPGLVLPAQTECEEAEEEDGGGDDGGEDDRGETDGNIQAWLAQFEILQHLVSISEAAPNLERQT